MNRSIVLVEAIALLIMFNFSDLGKNAPIS